MEPLKQILLSSAKNTSDSESSRTSTSSSVKTSTHIGLLLLALLMFIWMMLAELDEVISATGRIIEPRDIERIQHLEGGIVGDILVEEGDRVYEGQVLATLRDIDSTSELTALSNEIDALRGEISVFTALLNEVPPDLNPIQSENVANLFLNYWQSELDKNQLIDNTLQMQIAKDQQLLESMQQRLQSSEQQQTLMLQKVEIRDELYERQVSSLIELIQAQIDALNMQREVENLDEAILEKRLSMSATQTELYLERAQRRADYTKNLLDAQQELYLKLTTFDAVSDRVERLKILSPADGIIDHINFNYLSAVIPPGESFAELAPLNQTLLVELEVPPNDIGHIQLGQEVRVKVNTYDFSQYGWINGTVTNISRYSTETDTETYFTARVELERDYLVKNGAEYKVLPAMEVTAEVVTGRKTVADYFIKPIRYLFQGVFDER